METLTEREAVQTKAKARLYLAIRELVHAIEEWVEAHRGGGMVGAAAAQKANDLAAKLRGWDPYK